MKKQLIGTMLSLATITTLMTGCGGSSSNTTMTTTGTTGVAIDDYIQGATVCVDSDNNGELNPEIDTPCAISTTNATGQFTFSTDVSNSPLVMSGGTDVGTGKAFKGSYTAPAGSKVITPLTTIVQAIVNAGRPLAEAQTIVKTKLDLPDVDLTTYDPIAGLAANVATEVTEAKEVLAQQTNIQTILTTVSTTVAAPVTTIEESNVTDEVADQVAAIMLATPANDAIDITDDANVETIINATATAETDTTLDTELVAAIADQVDATNDEILANIENSTSTDIGELRQSAAQIADVTADNTDAIATALAAGTAVAVIVATTTEATNSLATDIDDAAADVTPAANLTTVATDTTTTDNATN